MIDGIARAGSDCGQRDSTFVALTCLIELPQLRPRISLDDVEPVDRIRLGQFGRGAMASITAAITPSRTLRQYPLGIIDSMIPKQAIEKAIKGGWRSNAIK